MRSEQAVARGVHDTRIPAQGNVGNGQPRRLGERAHPDTRPAIWGASPYCGAVDQGDGRYLRSAGVDRSHCAVWNWVHTLFEAQRDPPTAQPLRVAVDEKQIEVDGEKKWLYAAIDTESKLLLEVDTFSRRGTDPVAAFLHRLIQKHDVADTEFLVGAGGYLTALARHELSGRLDYRTRNHIEKWFQIVCESTAFTPSGGAVNQV